MDLSCVRREEGKKSERMTAHTTVLNEYTATPVKRKYSKIQQQLIPIGRGGREMESEWDYAMSELAAIETMRDC